MNSNVKKLQLYLASYLVTFIVAIPFLWMFVLSFKSNEEILNNPLQFPSSLNLQNYIQAFTTLNILQLYKNSLIVAFFTILLLLATTFMSSFALSRLVFKSEKLRNQILFVLFLGLTIPKFILLFPVYRLTIYFHLHNTYASLVLPYVATEISFNTLLFTGFLRSFPKEVEEAAIIDGCSLRKLCQSVVLPMIQPVIATIFIFDFISSWNEFPFAMTLLSDQSMFTLPVGLSMFRGQWSIDYGAIVAASVLTIIPQLVFYGFFQKYIIEGMTAGAVKG